MALTIDNWVVELHGTLRTGLWHSIDSTIDEIQNDVFCSGAIRSWVNGNTQVFLPRADEDVVLVFSHILHHFYRGGIGLRQICDWCRLLWIFKESLNIDLLRSRIKKMGVMSEWRTFGAFIVDYLGMPEDAIPLYLPDVRWKRKANRLGQLILEMGNFGYSRDLSYQRKKSPIIRKTITAIRLAKDSMRQLSISPFNPIRAWLNVFITNIVNK